MLSRSAAVRSASEPIAWSCELACAAMRVELGAGAGQRFEEAVGALVAVRGELGEALVDQAEAAVDLRDHPLRRAILLGDPLRQRLERGIGMVDVGGERFRRFGAGLADARRRLLDQRRDRRRLDVDAGADFVERRGGAFEQCVERARKAGFRFARRAPSPSTPALVDLGEARGEPLGRFGDQLVGVAACARQASLTCCPNAAACSADWLPIERSCSDKPRARFFGARQIVEQDGNVVARGFGGAVERFAVALQLLAAAVELAG